jgi:hypothetical protein
MEQPAREGRRGDLTLRVRSADDFAFELDVLHRQDGRCRVGGISSG